MPTRPRQGDALAAGDAVGPSGARAAWVVATWVAVATLLVGGMTGLAVVDESGTDVARQPVAVPDTPAGGQLEWVMAALAGPVTEEDLRAHLNAEFLGAVPAGELIGLFGQLRANGPYTLTEIEGSRDHELVVILDGRMERVRTSLAVEQEPPHLISGLLFKPAGASNPPPVTSWRALDDTLRQAAPEVGFLAAEVVDGQCRPIHAVAPDNPLALGSAFKLYVLGAAADAVKAGRLSWSTPVEIRDDTRVQASARTEKMRTGERPPLGDLARHMIEVSDNTATDLVLETVGRRAVEEVQSSMGMTDPARNVPFLSAREMTLVKFGKPPLVDEYVRLDAEGRRKLLDDRLPRRPARIEDMELPPGPVAVDTIEWFASASDLCRAHVALQSKGEEVRQILGHNPGIEFGPDAAYIAFKGGSEPGVVAGSWYIEHRDGRKFAISILLRNREGNIETSALSAAGGAFLLASA